MASAELAYSRGGASEDIWKVATELHQARNFRRSSLQPTPPASSYRRDSLTAREPLQSYRRDSITARDSSVRDYRSGSLSRDPFIPNYRRDSITRDQDYRRTSSSSVAHNALQNYRRDSLTTTRDPIADYNSRRDSLKGLRDSVTRESTPQSNGTTGRRGSDADDISWIEKYKRSDHHTDRLVNKRIDDAKAMTASLSDDRRSSDGNRSSAFSTFTPSSQSSQVPQKPLHYEGTNRLTVFLQPAQASTPRSYPDHPRSSTNHHQPLHRPSSETIYSSAAPSPRLPPSSLSSNDYSRSPVIPRPSSVIGSSVSAVSSAAFRRRCSVDSSLLKASRSSAFTPFVPTTYSNHSDFRTSPATISHPFSAEPHRPNFSRAPSLPPSFQSRPTSCLPLPSTSLTSNGFSRRSSVEGSLTSGSSSHTSRRFSLANISDLSTPNYRRSVDLSALKSSTGGYRSPYLLSTFGSDHHRRGSYDTPSSLSSPLSPLSPSNLPPPSERIFGSRGTHSSLRRYRRSLADG